MSQHIGANMKLNVDVNVHGTAMTKDDTRGNRQKVSEVWEHFTQLKDENKVQCKHCKTEVSSKSGTSGLWKHLRKKHIDIAATLERGNRTSQRLDTSAADVPSTTTTRDLPSETQAGPSQSSTSEQASGPEASPSANRNKTDKLGNEKDHLKLEDYFMAVAVLSSKRSKDPVTKVGACIVNQDQRIVSTGNNGIPSQFPDHEISLLDQYNDDHKDLYEICKVGGSHKGCNKMKGGAVEAMQFIKQRTVCVCHAEMSAIMNKNSADLKGCTMYTTLFPCNECVKLIIQAGLSKIVYLSKMEHMPERGAAEKVLQETNIQCWQFESKKEEIVVPLKAVKNTAQDVDSPSGATARVQEAEDKSRD